MKKTRWLSVCLLGLLWLNVSGCGDAHFRKGSRALNHGEHQTAVVELREAVKAHPDKLDYVRELGIAYFHVRDFDRAEKVLEHVSGLRPRDGRNAFYLGLTYEQQAKFAQAIAAYNTYSSLTFFNPMKQQLRARVNLLTLKLSEYEVRQALKEESKRTETPPENTVAVLYFRNVAERSEWQPLLKGLTSILITDLGKVQSVKLVERIKLEALLREIELSSSEMYDRFTAPRAGRILGAGRVIVGGATAAGDAGIHIDAGVVEIAQGTMLSTGTRASGRLDEILRIEKDLVFAIIDQLGVRLSETEREEIQKLPTRSSLAFTAFCRGLDFSDRMDFASARQAFKEAVRLDPNFKEAKSELEKIEITPLNDLQFQRLASLDPLETPAQQHLESTAGVFAGVQQSNPATVPLLQTTGILTVTGDLPVGSK